MLYVSNCRVDLVLIPGGRMEVLVDGLWRLVLMESNLKPES